MFAIIVINLPSWPPSVCRPASCAHRPRDTTKAVQTRKKIEISPKSCPPRLAEVEKLVNQHRCRLPRGLLGHFPTTVWNGSFRFHHFLKAQIVKNVLKGKLQQEMRFRKKCNSLRCVREEHLHVITATVKYMLQAVSFNSGCQRVQAAA